MACHGRVLMKNLNQRSMKSNTGLPLKIWGQLYKHFFYCGGWIGWDHMDSKSVQPGATPGLSAI